MVLGMNSGRSGDGRRSNNPHQGRRERIREKDSSAVRQDTPTSHTVPPHPHKHQQPSAEQVHIARMLTEDRTPDDMRERIEQVQAIVDCPEESILIALHDNEFDVEKACETLLDSNGSSKEEWTTMSTSKKSKKKASSTGEQQSHGGGGSSGRRRGGGVGGGGSGTVGGSSGGGNKDKDRGSSKSAAQHTRQNYGGSVAVSSSSSTRLTEDHPPSTMTGSGTDSRERRPRGGGTAGVRGRQPRRGNGGGRGGYRRNNEGRRDPGGSGFEGRFPPRHQRQQKPVATTTTTTTTEEESWDKDVDEPNVVTVVTTTTKDTTAEEEEEEWDLDNSDPPPPPPPERSSPSPTPPSEDWIIVDTPTGPGPSFPEALGRHPYPKRESTSPIVIKEEVTFSTHANKTSKAATRHRKFKVSQIPDQPVEMPSGIDTLSYDMSVLGIDFGIDTTPITPPPSSSADIQTSTDDCMAISTTPTGVSNPSFEDHSPLNQSAPGNSSLLSKSPFADIADDPVIISSFKEKPPDNLEPPPGLVHPSQQQQPNEPTPTPQTSLLPHPPEPISLPPLTTTSPVPPTQVPPSSTLLSSESLAHSSTAASSYPSTGGIGLGNSSFSVPAATPASSTVATAPSSSQSLFSTHQVNTAAASGPSVIPTVIASTGGTSSVPAAPQSLSSTLSAGGQNVPQAPPTASSSRNVTSHSSQFQGKLHSSGGSGGGSNVHPMAAAAATPSMVYPPHLLPQFPSPYGTTLPMMPPYTYDVDQMSRYQGFYGGQHPTSQDQSSSVSLSSSLGRDPQSVGSSGGGTLPFGSDNKYDSSTSSNATNPASQQQNQQQQGGAATMQQPPNQMNAFYSHYHPIYTMYPPHMGMAAATGYSTQMAHKAPTGANTYPVGTSYQPNPQYPAYDDEYAKQLYAATLAAKNTQVPSSTSVSAADFSGYSKHQFDNKGSASYNNYLPMTAMGGYMMGHHHVPPMGTTPIMTHDASSRSKSHKFGSTGTTWPGAGSAQH